MTVSDPRLIIALDFDTPDAALALAQSLDPSRCRLKVGKELFTRGGPRIVTRLQALGFTLFLDLKFHDIPNTVAQAVRAAADLGVWMVNVHALGGPRMMEAAREALIGFDTPPKLIAVTILTSMGSDELKAVGLPAAEQAVPKLAALAQSCGLDGVVCSAREAATLRQQCGDDFLLVTPGIRPAWAAADDQTRIMTPEQAMAAGADYLVVGRPVTRADSPRAAVERILATL